MGRRSCRRVQLLTLALALASGCAAPQRAKPPPPSAQTVVQALHARELPGDNPFVLDARAQERILRKVGMHGSQRERLQRAVRYLTSEDGLHFQYAPQTTRTAREAFRSPRGDCMTYASLLYAVARTLRVDVVFTYARRSLLYTEEEESFVASTHIALAHDNGTDVLLVDLASWMAGWQNLQYEPVHEYVAAALFFNNIAVEALHRGHPTRALAILEVLARQAPEVPEVHVNLGALLLRQGHTALAHQRLEAALERFPEHPMLWLHALRAARLSGDSARAEQLLLGAERVAQRNPSFHLLRAMEAWHQQDYARAESHLEQALVAVPDSPLLLAWQVRTTLAQRRTQQGLALYARLRQDFPTSAWARQLPQLHPELALWRSVPLPQAPQLARRTKPKPQP